MTLPRVRSVDREPIVYNDNEPTRVQTCDDDTSLFPVKSASRYLRPCAGKAGVAKNVLVMLGYHSIQQMMSISHDKSDFGRNSPLTERRTSSANHLFTLHSAAQADHRLAIPILHMKYRAQFLLGVGWGCMSYWVYVTLCWSVIHGIKRKPHLSVVWNWYHFVAIAILHQPRPTDSADVNTR